jgi:hypothetical protein
MARLQHAKKYVSLMCRRRPNVKAAGSLKQATSSYLSYGLVSYYSFYNFMRSGFLIIPTHRSALLTAHEGSIKFSVSDFLTEIKGRQHDHKQAQYPYRREAR